MQERQRVFLIHGWTGRANKDWFPWAKEELTRRGFKVFVPEMPDPDNPSRERWITTLKDLVNPPKPTDILVGHSIGCLAVLRYLETLTTNQKIGQVVLVAPWEVLSDAALENENDHLIFQDWIGAPTDYQYIQTKAELFIALFSKDDPLVPYKENLELFKKKLNPQIISFDNMGHFTAEEGATKLPQLLKII